LTTRNKVYRIKASKDQQRSANRFLPLALNGDPLHCLPYIEEDEDMRIAVLDDNPDIGEMLQHALARVGHTVDVYYSPSKFLATFMEPTTASAPFDLLIVDLFLSEGISGAEIIHQAWKDFPGLPVILISAASSWQIEPARKTLSGVRVLRKPFSLATLQAMVKELST
jgi:DNA-binding response OmpR family regulator